MKRLVKDLFHLVQLDTKTVQMDDRVIESMKRLVVRELNVVNQILIDKLDGISNCFDDYDEQNCTAVKCQLNQRIFCPRENRCAKRENSFRYFRHPSSKNSSILFDSFSCDGIVDCKDNSDEEHCQQCHQTLNVFQCDSQCK